MSRGRTSTKTVLCQRDLTTLEYTRTRTFSDSVNKSLYLVQLLTSKLNDTILRQLGHLQYLKNIHLMKEDSYKNI